MEERAEQPYVVFVKVTLQFMMKVRATCGDEALVITKLGIKDFLPKMEPTPQWGFFKNWPIANELVMIIDAVPTQAVLLRNQGGKDPDEL